MFILRLATLMSIIVLSLGWKYGILISMTIMNTTFFFIPSLAIVCYRSSKIKLLTDQLFSFQFHPSNIMKLPKTLMKTIVRKERQEWLTRWLPWWLLLQLLYCNILFRKSSYHFPNKIYGKLFYHIDDNYFFKEKV